METLKINYVMIDTGRSGGNRTLLNFANEFAKMGHSVSITTGNHVPWFRFDKSVCIDVITIPKISYQYFKAMLFLQKRLSPHGPASSNFPASLLSGQVSIYDYLNNQIYARLPKADVNIATFSSTVYPVMWASKSSVPFYHMQHFETLFVNDSQTRSFIKNTYYLPIPKVANSLWLAHQIKKLTGEQVEVINPGVEHDVFYPREHIAKKPAVAVVALGKGGWKNLDLIVRSVKTVHDRLKGKKEIELRLFGNKLSKKYNCPFVRCYENLSDIELAHLYSDSDIQVTASVAESFPLPPLEAMACGTAVITSPYGTEDYAVDRNNCLIVPPNNEQRLVEALELLIEDTELCERIRRNGIETARKFRYDSQASKLYNIMTRLADRYTSINHDLHSDFEGLGVPLY